MKLKARQERNILEALGEVDQAHTMATRLIAYPKHATLDNLVDALNDLHDAAHQARRAALVDGTTGARPS
jgi:ClpP class serine protease